MAHDASLPSQTVFSLLKQQPQGAAQLVVRETSARMPQGPVCHALDLDGRPLVLVPITAGSDLADESNGRAVTLRRRVLLQGGEERTFIAVRCEDEELDRQFAIFADDLIGALEGSPANPVPVTTDVLARWRSLFDRLPARPLGQSALTGLLGELHLLEAIAVRDPRGALSSWRGWDGSRHDFQSGCAAVEVKTTTNRLQFLVEIAGIWQLDPPEGKPLYLLAEQFEPVTSGGDSVPDAIERVIQTGVSASGLYANLAELGYRRADSEGYRRLRFARLQARLCPVEADFPRIVRSSLADPALADRIVGLTYSIDVGSLPAAPDDPVGQAAILLIPENPTGTQT